MKESEVVVPSAEGFPDVVERAVSEVVKQLKEKATARWSFAHLGPERWEMARQARERLEAAGWAARVETTGSLFFSGDPVLYAWKPAPKREMPAVSA